MNKPLRKPLPATARVALVLLALFAGCEKQAATTDSATGTTTTAAPAASAGQIAKQAEDRVADAATTAKVKTALLADPDVKALRIDVDTRDGVVTLSGTVMNASNIERAATIAKGIDGVKSVDNRLTVKASG